MATITATTAGFLGEAKAVANGGTVTRIWQYISTGTMSSGDVIYNPNWRLPKGAFVTSVKVSGKTVDGTGIVVPCVRVYNSASAATDTVFGSITLSPVHASTEVVGTTLPLEVSIADDSAQPHYAHFILKFQANASGTGSASMDLIVQYVMDR
jgi:hypothetical protein